VVRAANERTERACIETLRSGLPCESQCVVIHERPFSNAVRRAFEIGIESARPWLIAVDADLLLLDDVVCRIREVCGKMAPEAFCATPLFLCNTLGGLATRGLHCYRASLLDEALRATPNAKEPLRPESAIQDAMRQRGYTRECYAKVFGLHEYEQSYRHLYIKSMLRARKEGDPFMLMKRLRDAQEESNDATVALWGFEDALAGENLPDEYDWDALYPLFEGRMRDHGLQEKPALDCPSVDKLVRDHLHSHDYRADMMTLPWIREILDFAHGASGALEYIERPPLSDRYRARV
ncbi:MAG: hypothetical protein JKY96_04150, partial [Phycisphaerales bacterium]|nr:hypothetical protein [Phycisphaerales bacterium]